MVMIMTSDCEIDLIVQIVIHDNKLKAFDFGAYIITVAR